MIRTLLTVALLLTVGCQTTLDKRQAELIRTWGEANRAFATAIDVYREKVDETMGKHFQNSREEELRDFSAWLGRQTSKGVLVQTNDEDEVIVDENGNVLPMKAHDLVKAFEQHNEVLAAITEEERDWEDFDSILEDAIRVFREMNTVNLTENEEIAKAKESAQRFLDSAFAALASGAVAFAAAP